MPGEPRVGRHLERDSGATSPAGPSKRGSARRGSVGSIVAVVAMLGPSAGTRPRRRAECKTLACTERFVVIVTVQVAAVPEQTLPQLSARSVPDGVPVTMPVLLLPMRGRAAATTAATPSGSRSEGC